MLVGGSKRRCGGEPGSEAAFSIELTSSALVSRPTINTMSVIEELSIGTRMACPLSLPLSSGNTSATAVADPVEVGARLSMLVGVWVVYTSPTSSGAFSAGPWRRCDRGSGPSWDPRGPVLRADLFAI